MIRIDIKIICIKFHQIQFAPSSFYFKFKCIFHFSEKDILVSNYRLHTVQCAKNAASALKAKQSQFEGCKENMASNSDDTMLPCEFCDGLIPMRKLLEHQVWKMSSK